VGILSLNVPPHQGGASLLLFADLRCDPVLFIFFRRWANLVAGLRGAWRPLPDIIVSPAHGAGHAALLRHRLLRSTTDFRHPRMTSMNGSAFGVRWLAIAFQNAKYVP
jgi:hypothetical protein